MKTKRLIASILPVAIIMMNASCSSDKDDIQEPQSSGHTLYVEIPADYTTETRAALSESVEGKRYYTFAEGDKLQIGGTISGSGKKFYSVATSGSSTPAPFTMKSKSGDGKTAVFGGYVYFEDGTSDMTSTFATFEATLLPDGWETFGSTYKFFTIESDGRVSCLHSDYSNRPCKTLSMAFSRYAWVTHTFTDGKLADNPINLTCKNAFLNITINDAPAGKWYVNGFGESNNYCQGGYEDTDPVTAEGGVLNIGMAFPAGVKNISIIMGISGGKGTDRTLTLPAANTTDAGKIYNITRNYSDLGGGGKE